MRANQIIYESRGVTARTPGETYVSDSDPQDVLTIQDISVISNEGDSFDSLEDLEAAIDRAIPKGSKRIDDNAKNSGSRAAAICLVTDANNGKQTWVRYFKAIPPGGIHGLWKTLRGYKYGKGAKEESIPIKPSDLIKDENFRDANQLSNEIVQNTKSMVAGTGNEELAEVMKQAVAAAQSGSATPIKGASKYFNVLQKYGGEYLGPIALISPAGNVGGDTPKLMSAFELSNWNGSSVSFPQDTAMELIDSVVKIGSGATIQVSSKISTSGGAASSLSGVYKQVTPEIQQRFPNGVNIIKNLATLSSLNGPMQVAFDLKIIDKDDVAALTNLDRASKNIQDLGTPRLIKMTQEQGVAAGTLERDDYRVFYHVLTAVMNKIIPMVNQMEEFQLAIIECLNNNQYVQLVTKGTKQGDDVVLEYYTKFPAVFQGKAQLVNKTYFATGQKGRIGFKLK